MASELNADATTFQATPDELAEGSYATLTMELRCWGASLPSKHRYPPVETIRHARSPGTIAPSKS